MIVSAAEPARTRSLLPKLQPRARSTFLSTGTSPSGDARAAYSRDNGLKVCFKLLQVVYKLLGVREIATSSNYSRGNDGVERVNHMMTQMLAMVVNELQNNWDVHPPHQVEFT